NERSHWSGNGVHVEPESVFMIGRNMQIRMAYWRQWRKPRTKVRNLMSRGVHVRTAVACGITSKGPWRSSKTPGIQQALSNAYLKSQGLFALRDGWIRLHHSK
ncbi:hypothetical protein, partial [Aeromonas sp. QDB56]|uniref:hypothetical protein n=1 Tax=Aeromonas sp. QDB56 TaxID=2990495 RepID=UPI003FA43AD0